MNTIFIKRLLFLVISLFYLQLSFGQDNYMPCEILTLKGDTINGLIDYRDWKFTPKEIYFKKDNSAKIESFGPNEISYFKVNNQQYISSTVEVENSPIIANNLDRSPNLKIKEITTFVEIIFDGEKKLYQFKSVDYLKDNFYISINNDLKLLIYKKYVSEGENKISIIENKKYIGQLSFYLDNCSEVQSKLKKSKYNESSLSRIFNIYYECSKKETVYKRNPKSIGLKFGALVGASNTSLRFRSDAYESFLTKTGYSKSTNFVGGVFLDIVLPRNFERYSIYNELSYSSYTVEGTSIGETRSTFSKIGNKAISLNSLFRYKHPIGNQFIFVNAGLSLSFVVDEINEMEQTFIIYPDDDKVTGEALDDPRKSEQGLLFGIGIKHQKYALEVRYMRGNGMSSYASTRSITDRVFFLLSYQF